MLFLWLLGNSREGFIFAKLRKFVELNPHEMAKLFCHLLMKVKHALVANFCVTNRVAVGRFVQFCK